eukprot:989375-Rhodomonas_salina.1
MAANLVNSSFISSFSSNLARSTGVPIIVAPAGTPEQENSQFVGEAYELSTFGAPKLLSCEPGYLLVNNTINTQACLFCPRGSYSVNPSDRCTLSNESRIAVVVCEVRSCYPCSVGALCFGGAEFESKVKNAVWRTEWIPFERSWLYRIQWAPPGYIMIRGASPADDQSIPCDTGQYALEAGVNGGQVMFKTNLASFVADERYGMCVCRIRHAICCTDV